MDRRTSAEESSGRQSRPPGPSKIPCCTKLGAALFAAALLLGAPAVAIAEPGAPDTVDTADAADTPGAAVGGEAASIGSGDFPERGRVELIAIPTVGTDPLYAGRGTFAELGIALSYRSPVGFYWGLDLRGFNDDRYDVGGPFLDIPFYFQLRQGGLGYDGERFNARAGRFVHDDVVDNPYSLFVSSRPKPQFLYEIDYQGEWFRFLTRSVELTRNSAHDFPDKSITFQTVGINRPNWEIGYQDAIVAVDLPDADSGEEQGDEPGYTSGGQKADGTGPVFVPEYFFNPLPGYFIQYVLGGGQYPWLRDINHKSLMGFYGVIRGEFSEPDREPAGAQTNGGDGGRAGAGAHGDADGGDGAGGDGGTLRDAGGDDAARDGGTLRDAGGDNDTGGPGGEADGDAGGDGGNFEGNLASRLRPRTWELQGQILVDDFDPEFIWDRESPVSPQMMAWMLSGELGTGLGSFRLTHAGAHMYTFQTSGERRYSYTHYPDVAFPRGDVLQPIDYRDNYFGFYLGENTAAFRLDWEHKLTPRPGALRVPLAHVGLDAGLAYTISGSKSPLNSWHEYESWRDHETGDRISHTRWLDEDVLEHGFELGVGAKGELHYPWGTLGLGVAADLGIWLNVLELEPLGRSAGDDFPADSNNVERYVPSEGETHHRAALRLETRLRLPR